MVLKAVKAGTINLCWKKLDRKSKKLNFMFKVADMGNVNALASVDTIEMLTKDLKTL